LQPPDGAAGEFPGEREHRHGTRAAGNVQAEPVALAHHAHPPLDRDVEDSACAYVLSRPAYGERRRGAE
jgi:hypothetical protein